MVSLLPLPRRWLSQRCPQRPQLPSPPRPCPQPHHHPSQPRPHQREAGCPPPVTRCPLAGGWCQVQREMMSSVVSRRRHLAATRQPAHPASAASDAQWRPPTPPHPPRLPTSPAHSRRRRQTAGRTGPGQCWRCRCEPPATTPPLPTAAQRRHPPSRRGMPARRHAARTTAVASCHCVPTLTTDRFGLAPYRAARPPPSTPPPHQPLPQCRRRCRRVAARTGHHTTPCHPSGRCCLPRTDEMEGIGNRRPLTRTPIIQSTLR